MSDQEIIQAAILQIIAAAERIERKRIISLFGGDEFPAAVVPYNPISQRTKDDPLDDRELAALFDPASAWAPKWPTNESIWSSGPDCFHDTLSEAIGER